MDCFRYQSTQFSLCCFGCNTEFGCIFIYAVLTCTGIKKVHIKSGELKISEEFVTIENSIFPVNKINRIKIKASNYLGPFSGNGTGNIIEVYNSTDKKEEVTFFIKSFNQKIELDKILSIWIDQGINVSLNIL